MEVRQGVKKSESLNVIIAKKGHLLSQNSAASIVSAIMWKNIFVDPTPFISKGHFLIIEIQNVYLAIPDFSLLQRSRELSQENSLVFDEIALAPRTE